MSDSQRLDDEPTLRTGSSAEPRAGAVSADDGTLEIPRVRSGEGLTPATLRPGDLFAGGFQILSCIGRGGFSFVFKARNRGSGEVVALKFLAGDQTGPDIVNRMQRELRLARDLRHPNIVRVHELLEAEGFYCLVMEYVEGATLKELVHARRPLPVNEAIRILVSLTSAMAAVHAAGIVHRDLKPQNVIVTPDGTVKLLDFGLAKAPDTTGLTATGTILGTPEYMSPEQVEGRAAGRESDIYSLGVIAWELLAGDPPYRGDTPIAIALQHVRSRVVDVRKRRPETPGGLSDLIGRMTQVAAARRPGAALEVLQDLERIAAGDLGPSRRKRPRLRRLAAAATLAALLAGGGLLIRARRSTGAAADPFADGVVHVAVVPLRSPEGAAASTFSSALANAVAERISGPGVRLHFLRPHEARRLVTDQAEARAAGIEHLVTLDLSGGSEGSGFSLGVSVLDAATGRPWRTLEPRRFSAIDFVLLDQVAQAIALEYTGVLREASAAREARGSVAKTGAR